MTTIWITADHLSPFNTALTGFDPADGCILMIESIARGRQIAYHKRKLVLVYAAMRHRAQELRDRGFDVDYYEEATDFAAALAQHCAARKPARIRMMEQSEWGVTEQFKSMIEALGPAAEITPTCNFVATTDEFSQAFGAGRRMTMETFYRRMRRKTGLLMEADEPVGGRWNFDAENRKPPASGLQAPLPCRFTPDRLTQAVMEMVERHFPTHPGTTEGFDLPVARADALLALDDFIDHRLDLFGPYEDAMVRGEPILFHSALSSAINLGLLHPLECCRRAEQAYRAGHARLASVEGFVRQLIGWREFIRGIYDRFMPEYRERNELGANLPVPQFYWTADTDMACMHEAVTTTLALGWAHHILRLMVLSNFGLLAGVRPQALNDWFWQMYVDGYDWVMVPNVIGMALHADGGIVGTKPYAASARYIDNMSNYCKGCRYSPKVAIGDDACPFNSLYWDFLARHQARFAANTRMALVMRSLATRPEPWLAEVRARAAQIRAKLEHGEKI